MAITDEKLEEALRMVSRPFPELASSMKTSAEDARTLFASVRAGVAASVNPDLGLTGAQLLRVAATFEPLIESIEAYSNELAAVARDLRELLGKGL